ncbi:MAG TPA: gamma-glutamyltransferase [Candidatus Limnocylindria bacterium]|nr:gamma-glutamyltransferase [Candidatus Limnocylindria bacterium]
MATRSASKIEKTEAASGGGMITAEHPLAAEAGARILARGGNAVDAAVGAAFAMGVVEPTTSGIGGVAWCVIREPDGSVTTINGSGAAPFRATVDMYDLETSGAAGMYGWPATKDNAQNVGYRAIGLPGAVGCLCRALERFGSLQRADVMRDAISLADSGWEVDWPLSLAFGQYYDRLTTCDASREIFLRPDGAPRRAPTGLEPGDMLVQRDLAQSLRTIAADGPDALYHGELGRAVAEDIQRHGGLLSVEDFASFEVREREPLVIDYRGFALQTLPEASGAITVVEALNILSGFELDRLGPLSAEALHLLAEAQRRAFADRFTYLADPAVVGAAIYDELASPAHAAKACATIDPKQATPDAGATPATHSTDCTTHVNAVDREGRMVALTATLGGAFGSGVVAKGTGIILGNVMTWFDPRPGRVNSIAGGRRILPAIAPMLLLKDGAPFLCAGAPGGRRIISAMLHVITNVADWGMGPQQAVNTPRIHCESTDTLVDSRVPEADRAELAAMGHRLSVRNETFASSHFARPSAIRVDGAERRAGVGAMKISTAIGVD